MSDSDCCYPFVYGRESLCGSGSGEIPPDSDSDWLDANSRGFVGKDGDLWIWRGQGQKPTRIPGQWRRVSQVSVPARFGGTASVTLAIKSDGSLWGWAGTRGDLGLVDYPEECYRELGLQPYPSRTITLRAKIRSSVEGFFASRQDGLGTANGVDLIFGFSDSPLSREALSSTLLQVKQEKDGQVDDTFDGVEATARADFLYRIFPYGELSGVCSFNIDDGGEGYTSQPTVEVSVRGPDLGRFYASTPSSYSHASFPVFRAVVEGGSVVRIEGVGGLFYTGELDVVITGGNPRRPASASMRHYSSHLLLPKLIDGGSGYTLSSSRTIGAYFTFPPGTRFGEDSVKIFGATIKEAGISSIELKNNPPLTGDEPTRMTTGAISGETVGTPDIVEDVYYVFEDGAVVGAEKGPLYTLPSGYPTNNWTLTSRTSGHSNRPLIVKKTVNNGSDGNTRSQRLRVYVFGDRVIGLWQDVLDYPWDGVTRPTVGDNAPGVGPQASKIEWTGFERIAGLNCAFGKVDSSVYDASRLYDVGWEYGYIGGGPLSGLPVPDQLYQTYGGGPSFPITYKSAVGPQSFTNSVNWVNFIDGPKVESPSADVFFTAQCASPAHGTIVYNDKGYPVSVNLLDPGSGFRSEPESPAVTMNVLEPTLLSDEADFVELSSAGLLLDSSGNGYRHDGPLGVRKVQSKKQVNMVYPNEYMLGNTTLTFSRPSGKSLAVELTSIRSLYERPVFWNPIYAGPRSNGRAPNLFAADQNPFAPSVTTPPFWGWDGGWGLPYPLAFGIHPFSVGLASSSELRKLIEPDLPPLPVPSAAIGYVPSELSVTSLPDGCSLSSPSFTSLSRIDGGLFVSSDGKRIGRDGRRAEEEPYIETQTQRPLSAEDVSRMTIPVSARMVNAYAEFTFSSEGYATDYSFTEYDASDETTFGISHASDGHGGIITSLVQGPKRYHSAAVTAKRFKCSEAKATSSVSASDTRQVLASGAILSLGQTTVTYGNRWRPLDSESYKWTLGTPVLSRSQDGTYVESFDDKIDDFLDEDNWFCAVDRKILDSDGNDVVLQWLEEFGYAVEDLPEADRFSVLTTGQYGTYKYKNQNNEEKIKTVSFDSAKKLIERISECISPPTLLLSKVEAASPGFVEAVRRRIGHDQIGEALVKAVPFTVKKLWTIQTKFENSPQWGSKSPGDTYKEIVVQNGIVVSVDGQSSDSGGQRPLTAGQLSMEWYDPGMPYSVSGYTFHGLESPHVLEVTASDGGTPPEVVF